MPSEFLFYETVLALLAKRQKNWSYITRKKAAFLRIECDICYLTLGLQKGNL